MSEALQATDVKAELSNLASRISKLKAEKSRIEGRVESLKQQLAVVEAQCRALDVEPDELDEMIKLRSETLYNVIQSMEGAVSDIERRRDQVSRV